MASKVQSTSTFRNFRLAGVINTQFCLLLVLFAISSARIQSFYEIEWQADHASNLPDEDNSDITIHLIVVAATHDRDIGKSTSQDMDDVQTTLQTIAKEMEVKFNVTRVYGENFDLAHIMAALNGISNSRNEVIIFTIPGMDITPQIR